MNSDGQSFTKLSKDQPTILYGGIALAMLGSAAVLWLATGEVLVVLAYSLGMAVLLGAALMFERLQSPKEFETLAVPDWSVTAAAIESFANEAVAITDRANRLTCANSAYVDWFGSDTAPPNLPLDRASLEQWFAWCGKPGVTGMQRRSGYTLMRVRLHGLSAQIERVAGKII